jgi:single-strand DNA-binding protein
MALAKINGLFRLTRDIEVQYTASGSAVGKLGLACSEKYKDKETQLFLDATVFGKVAEIIAQYAGTKGTQIYLSGKLQTDSWDDKNTGQKRYKTTMIVEGFDFVSNSKTQQTNHQPQQPSNAPPQGYQGVKPNQPQQAPAYAPNDFDNDDVPF